MSPICSESYLFFFLAFLKLAAYFSSVLCDTCVFPLAVDWPKSFVSQQGSECFGHFSRSRIEFTHEVPATATASSITVAGTSYTQTGRHVHLILCSLCIDYFSLFFCRQIGRMPNARAGTCFPSAWNLVGDEVRHVQNRSPAKFRFSLPPSSSKTRSTQAFPAIIICTQLQEFSRRLSGFILASA